MFRKAVLISSSDTKQLWPRSWSTAIALSTYSKWKEIKRGVPQGSVLRPMLFNVFINDLFFHIKSVKLNAYADDEQLYDSDIDPAELEKRLLRELNRPFPHSNKQWHRVEVGVDKNTVNVWKCPPEPRSGAIVRTHWSVMRERSIVNFCFRETEWTFGFIFARKKVDRVWMWGSNFSTVQKSQIRKFPFSCAAKQYKWKIMTS